MIDPRASVRKKSRDSVSDFVERNPKTFLRRTVCPGPFPGTIEHPAMKFAKIRLIEKVAPLPHARVQSPFVSLKNVTPLKLVKFALGG
jgi:hypothetical protein